MFCALHYSAVYYTVVPSCAVQFCTYMTSPHTDLRYQCCAHLASVDHVAVDGLHEGQVLLGQAGQVQYSTLQHTTLQYSRVQ